MHNKRVYKKILENFITVFSLVFGALALLVGYLDYSLNRYELSKEADPLLQYNYSEERGAFEVFGGNDVEIREVSWMLPSVYTSSPERINRHPRVLTLSELKDQLYADAARVFDTAPEKVTKDMVDCLLLKGKYATGIPLATQIKFRRRGETAMYQTTNLLSAQLVTSDNPYIEIDLADANSDERANFLDKAAHELKERFNKAFQATTIAFLESEEENCSNEHTRSETI